MTLNLADSADIMSAYDAVLSDELNWFLLQYSARIVDELSLYAFGIEGLEELKTKIDPGDDGQVLIGFLRVEADDMPGSWNRGRVEGSGSETGEGEGGEEWRRGSGEEDSDSGLAEAKYLLISYVSKSVVGVRRARAQVHTRRLGMIFKKHDAVLSVDDVSQLTNAAIAQSLAEPDPSLLTFHSSSSSPTTILAPGVTATASSPPLVSSMQQAQVQGLAARVDTSTTTAGFVGYTSPLGSPATLPPTVTQQQPIHHHHSLTAVEMGRSYSQPSSSVLSTAPPTTGVMNYVDLKPVKRSVSESTTTTAAPGLDFRHSSGSPTGGMKIGSQISNFLRRKKRGSGSAIAKVGWDPTTTYATTTTTGGGVSGGGSSGGQGGGGGRGILKGYMMGDVDESQESEDSMPPPTPPKDKGVYTPNSAGQDVKSDLEDIGGVGYTYPVNFSHVQHAVHVDEPVLSPGIMSISETTFRHTHSVSDYAVVSHEHLGVHGGRQGTIREDGDIVIVRPEEFGLYGVTTDEERRLPTHRQQTYGIDTLRKGKWAEPQGLSAVRDPVERARMRVEMQKQRMEEEREMLRVEEERQEMLKRTKAEFMRREEEEAEKRKARIQAEALQIAAERRRREEMEKEEEERNMREREERKRMERQKRMEEHLRLEEWRREQQRVVEENARTEEEERRRGKEERKKRIRDVEGEVKKMAREGAMMGWVTIQTDESVVWRRRYFKFALNTFYFYRNPKDLTQELGQLDVRGAVKSLKEPEDGYEDLKAIPHSFAIEFYDRAPWAMFADSEEEKYKLLGLLQYAAGL